MRVYVTGADGMLGTALLAALPDDWPVRGVSLTDFDIADAAAVAESIEDFAPDVVVHAAAHAIVDDCEVDPRRAFRVNVGGVRNVAAACHTGGRRLVYVSSDYVFDGTDTPDGGYQETDIPNPLSVYGMTKLAGERISAMVEDHLVVRTSWLFGGKDEATDHVLALIGRTHRGERIRLVKDQFSAPTYTVDLARALVFLLSRDITGTVHVVNEGRASWYDVAQAMLGGRLELVEPILLSEHDFIGERPRDSTLSAGRLAVLGFTMPNWPDAVDRFATQLATPAGPGGRT